MCIISIFRHQSQHESVIWHSSTATYLQKTTAHTTEVCSSLLFPHITGCAYANAIQLLNFTHFAGNNAPNWHSFFVSFFLSFFLSPVLSAADITLLQLPLGSSATFLCFTLLHSSKIVPPQGVPLR